MTTTKQYRIVYKCADGSLERRAGVNPTLDESIDFFRRNKTEGIGWSSHAFFMEETVSDLGVVLSTKVCHEV